MDEEQSGEQKRGLGRRFLDTAAKERRTLRYGRIKEIDGSVSTPSGGGQLVGARASLDSAGEVERRITVTRMALTGPLSLAWRKKKDKRELYVVIEGDGFAHVEKVDPDKRKLALKFVAEFNKRAADAART